MARIDTLANFLTDVSTAIKEKTGKTDPIAPANFDTEINSISGGGGDGGGYITDCSNLFDKTTNARGKLINTFLPCCKPTTAYKMFFENQSLDYDNPSVRVNMSLLDTSNCESFESAFEYTDLSDFDFSAGLDTSKVVNMQAMFCRCTGNTIDLTFINDTSNVTNMGWMFYNIRNLSQLDLSTFDFSKVTNASSMFASTGANLSSPTTVYVKDEAAQQFILNLSTNDRPSNWSTSNVIIKTQ